MASIQYWMSRTPVGAGHANVLAHRDGDRPPRALDLVGELDAGRGGADHEHATVGELIGIPVLEWVDLVDTGGHRSSKIRDAGEVARATGQYHAPATPRTLIGDDLITVVG